MFIEVYLNYESSTHTSKNKRRKQTIHPIGDIYRGNEKAVWHSEHCMAEARLWVKCEKAGYQVLWQIVCP